MVKIYKNLVYLKEQQQELANRRQGGSPGRALAHHLAAPRTGADSGRRAARTVSRISPVYVRGPASRGTSRGHGDDALALAWRDRTRSRRQGRRDVDRQDGGWLEKPLVHRLEAFAGQQ